VCVVEDVFLLSPAAARLLDDNHSDEDDDITLGSGDPQWETKSRFTEYSITSSVMPRSEGVSFCVRVFVLLWSTFDNQTTTDIAQICNTCTNSPLSLMCARPMNRFLTS